MDKKETIHVHRVGTVTAGASLVVFGSLFLLHYFLKNITYTLIFHLWPLILICLGVEILLSKLSRDTRFVYDKGAVVVMIAMLFLAMGMAGADYVFTNCIAPNMEGMCFFYL